MTGPGSGPTGRVTLLADANVLIDYRDSGDLAILSLVAQHVGPLLVASTVFDEVHDLGVDDCARLGVRIVEATTAQLDQAGRVKPRVSFNDGVCFVVCRDEGWVCVTNDRALQRLCRQHDVSVRFGLGLLLDLAAERAITYGRAEAVARRIQNVNPLHINDRVVADFLAALDRTVRR
ncbi:MAG: hypothetical protein OXE58_13565 [Acidobacteria bacterium]|nr:hypothetical protein [Acidobacteriota bacterium]